MAVVKFKGVSPKDVDNVKRVFNLLAEGKRAGEIDTEKVIDALGDRYKTKFWWPTKEDLKDWEQR